MMAGVVELLKDIMTLTERVTSLKESVYTLRQLAETHRDRICRLEAREEVLLEKATRSAVEAVHRMNNEYHDRLAALERLVKTTSEAPKTDGTE